MSDEERQCCRYCGGAGKFQVVSSVSDGAWAACFCSRATTSQTVPVMPDWQLIETAPKDVWARSTHILCAHDEKRWVRFGRYYGELKRWYYSGTNERTQWSETPGDAPTHWMPISLIPAVASPASAAGLGDMREALVTARDYVADAASGALTYEDSGDGFKAMAKQDLASIDAVLDSPAISS